MLPIDYGPAADPHDGPRHGYELSKLIEARSDGRLKFHVASLAGSWIALA